MPIFKDKKILFVHITKAAGSSIEKALGLDVNRVEENYNKENLVHFFWKGGVKLEEVQHYTLDQLIRKKLIGMDIVGSYFKFVIVRNPFDRCVSEWKYQTKMFKEKGWFGYKNKMLVLNSFEEYVKHLYFMYEKGVLNNRAHDRQQYLYVYDKKGKVVVDFVGKFENILQDWKIIKQKTGLEIDLPKTNSGLREHYRFYYNKKTRAMVEKIYKKDLQLFGYSF